MNILKLFGIKEKHKTSSISYVDQVFQIECESRRKFREKEEKEVEGETKLFCLLLEIEEKLSKREINDLL